MSKLSRTVLKEIVKECIIEIFEESFFAPGAVINESSRKRTTTPKKRPRKSHQSRQSHLDNVRYDNRQQSTMTNEVNNRFNNKVNQITSNLTSDPVMANIFKDTASTTLQQQNASSSRGGMIMTGGDAASLKVSNSDPTELFAESASKWATLAFSDPVNR